MDEKIKVSMAKATLDLLKKDCEDFKFLRPDGRMNFNAFINVLIANFYESFSAIEEKLCDDLRAALSAVPAYYSEKALGEILKVLAKRENAREGKRESAVFSFKPTKVSARAVMCIQNTARDESLSSFFRRMFSAYAGKPKNEREKIVCAENLAVLLKAMKKGAAVCIALKSGGVFAHASLYAVSPAKDELFNYVLFYDGKNNMTVRLANVETVSLLAERAFVPEENAALFARQVECGAQYPFYSTDREPIRVQLTEKGKELFRKIYLYRPTPVSVEGDIYTFECSANQLLYYFERFGDRALILSPKRLGIFMRNYYHYALKKYRTIYKTE